MSFFDDNVLLDGEIAKNLYAEIKDMPIVDFHCHLSAKDLCEDKKFDNIGKLWLESDHYKWRAMRLCGVDEKYITGDASYKEKFCAFAEIMPKLLGNPLYYFCHMELKRVFGFDTPLCAENALQVYEKSVEVLKDKTALDIISDFNVEYLATTDDPLSDLKYHGEYRGIKVAPTFRADRAVNLDGDFIKELAKNYPINTLEEYISVIESRLEFFIKKGCKSADCGLDFAPIMADKEGAEREYSSLISGNKNCKTDNLSAYVFSEIAKMCAKHDIVLQIHIGTFRNVNTRLYTSLGRDIGCDVSRGYIDTDALVLLFDKLDERGALPRIILYPLNTQYLKIACILSGAFRNVKIGPAWWFNDSVNGIMENFGGTAEYAVFGEIVGMLTDGRSYTGYVRFDFFRRLLCSFVAGYISRGEYDEKTAETLLKDICYNNCKEFLKI